MVNAASVFARWGEIRAAIAAPSRLSYNQVTRGRAAILIAGGRALREQEQPMTRADQLRVVATAEQIQGAVVRLGRTLSQDYGDRNPLLLGILKGISKCHPGQ